VDVRGIAAPVLQKYVDSSDGTRIAYYLIGSGPKRWVVPPAMGAPLVALKYLFERFADEYTFVTWDQRGFYASALPADPDALRVDDHMADMHAVIRAEGLDSFVLGGWSMAVQISLEYHHRCPSHVRALVLMNGPFERAAGGILPTRLGEALILGGLWAARNAGPILNPLSRMVLGRPGTGATLHRLGILAGEPAGSEFFDNVLAEFSKVDWRRYFTMARHLHDHSAAAYLRDIHAPTLIISGTHDRLTPVRVAERMHREIAGSELVVIPGATHYVVAEYPEVLTSAIASFLARADR
jgi:pimeloyl-ACP methyl ester carboxylesterase